MSISQIQQQNVSAAAAYTEYTLTVPSGAMEVTLQLRPGFTAANLFWYMSSNNPTPGLASNLPAVYATVPPGSSRTISGKLGGQTIYFQTDQSTQVLEFDYHADN